MNKKKFKAINFRCREILDSRGNPTVEVDLETSIGVFRSTCPAGLSKGEDEAVFIRSINRYFGSLSVAKVVENAEKVGKKIIEADPNDINQVDSFLKKEDGSNNFSKIGVNASLPISISYLRFFSYCSGEILPDYISKLSNSEQKMPSVYFNIINGGRHSGNELVFQEIMVCLSGKNFKDVISNSVAFFAQLGRAIIDFKGSIYTSKGDEGGFVPPISTLEEAMDLIMDAMNISGFSDIKVAIDCAANSFYKNGRYRFKRRVKHDIVSVSYNTKELIEYYNELIESYKIINMFEDPFYEKDLDGWRSLSRNKDIIIVGDDLLVTNSKKIERAVANNLCDCVLIKPNQIGTVTDTFKAINTARKNGLKVMVSHRSGETNDDFISDLAYGIGSDFFKAGAPFQGERISKYNKLIRIEEAKKEK